jgi:hypothetical protein
MVSATAEVNAMRTTLLLAALTAGAALAAGAAAPRDPDADKALRRAAERGDPRSEYELGRRIARGGDPAGQAVHWYRKAADGGDEDARRALADVSAWRGPGPRKGRASLERARACARALRADDPVCAGLLVAAANAGSAEAQCDVGKQRVDAAAAEDLYDSVHDIKLKTPRAAQAPVVEGVGWLRAAAEQGWPEAQYQLGRLLEEGTYVGKDPREALGWYRRAADQGHAKAWDALERLGAP